MRTFLGTQGDRWDSQADMFSALLGAFVALILLAPLHDRSLARLAGQLARERPRSAARGGDQ